MTDPAGSRDVDLSRDEGGGEVSLRKEAAGPAGPATAAGREPAGSAGGAGAAAGSDGAGSEVVAGPQPDRRRRTPQLVAAVTVIAVLLAALTGVLAVREVRARETADARTQGLAAGRNAAQKLLSFDYRHLDQDFAAGRALATGQFAKDYQKTTEQGVSATAKQYQVVLSAQVVQAAVANASPGQAVILAFVNQTTTSQLLKTPRVDQNRVRLTMREVDGSWKVAKLEAL